MYVSLRRSDNMMRRVERWIWLADVALRDRRTDEEVRAELIGREVVVRKKVRALLKHEGRTRKELKAGGIK